MPTTQAFTQRVLGKQRKALVYPVSKFVPGTFRIRNWSNNHSQGSSVDDNSIFLNEIRVFWNVTSCSSVDKYPHFGGTCYHYLPVTSKVAGYSEAVVPVLPNSTGSHTLRNSPVTI